MLRSTLGIPGRIFASCRLPVLQGVASPVISSGYGFGPAPCLSLRGPAATIAWLPLGPWCRGSQGLGRGFRAAAPDHPVGNREGGRWLAGGPVGTCGGGLPPGLILLAFPATLLVYRSPGTAAMLMAGPRLLSAPGLPPRGAGGAFPGCLAIRLPADPAALSRTRIQQGQGGACRAEGAAPRRRRRDPGPEWQRRALPCEQPQHHRGPGVQGTGHQQGEQGRQQGQQQQASDRVQGSLGGRVLGS